MRGKIEARVSEAEKESFTCLAAQENLSESDLLRKILREYLKRKEEPAEKKEKKEKVSILEKSNGRGLKEREIKFRVSSTEYLIIDRRAKEAKLSVSAYLRKKALGEKVVVIEGVKDFAYQLRKIGNNLNQLTNLANEGRIYSIDLSAVREGVQQLWKELRTFMEQQTKGETTKKENGSD